MDDIWFARYPRPLYYIHDNGGEFIGSGFTELFEVGRESKVHVNHRIIYKSYSFVVIITFCSSLIFFLFSSPPNFFIFSFFMSPSKNALLSCVLVLAVELCYICILRRCVRCMDEVRSRWVVLLVGGLRFVPFIRSRAYGGT